MSISKTKMLAAAFLVISLTQLTCHRSSPSASNEFVTANAPLIALRHVRLIDGTGTPAKEDQTILVEAGSIKAIGSAATLPIPDKAKVFELSGHTAIPGLVGMHEHLFYSTANG